MYKELMEVEGIVEGAGGTTELEVGGGGGG